MRASNNKCLTDGRKIEALQKSGVLLENVNPLNPNQRGFRFSKACFFRHPQEGWYARIVGFVENTPSCSIDIVFFRCSDGTRERLSSSTCTIGSHLYSAISQEKKYDNRPVNEELFIVASTKKEAGSIIKELSISGFWSLDRRVSIQSSSLSRIL